MLALSAARHASGVPASPDVMVLRQPDGATVTARRWGDERANGIETLDGHTILREPASGAWMYAMHDAAGNLVTSDQMVGAGPAPRAVPGLRRAPRAATESATSPAPNGMAVPLPPATGIHRLLVIVADFATPLSRGVTETQFFQHYFAGGSDYGTTSVADYWRTVSHGALSLLPAAETYGTTNDGIVFVTLGYRLPDSCKVDGASVERVTECHREVAKDAILGAADFVDFRLFDRNGDAYLDVGELHVMIVLRGDEGATGCPERRSTWGHRWSFSNGAPAPQGITVGHADGAPTPGVTRGGYMQQAEWHAGCAGDPGHPATIGVAIHELGHDFGVPDFYDTDSSSKGVGKWSVMGSGCWGRVGDMPLGSMPVWPDAYARWLLDFIEPGQLTATARGLSLPIPALAPAPAHGVYMAPAKAVTHWSALGCAAGSGEYFLLEHRGREGYDESLPGDGLLVWHVYEGIAGCAVSTDEGTREAPGIRLLALEQADNQFHLECYGEPCANDGDAGDPWSVGDRFTPTSTPNSRFYSGESSGLVVAPTAHDGAVMTVDVALPVCGDGLIDEGEGCDDGGTTNGDGCSATCMRDECWTCIGEPSTCEHLPIGYPCQDGDACTLSDTCANGTCVAGAPQDCSSPHACVSTSCEPTTGECVHRPEHGRCDPCSACDTARGCVVGPRDSCFESYGRASLVVTDTSRDDRDRFVWRWRKANLDVDVLHPDDVPDDYTVCLFDSADRLLVQTLLPAGGDCGRRSCWRPTKYALRYRDASATRSGIARMKLKAGHFRTVALVGHGPNLPDLPLPLALPVTLQLQRSDDTCWTSTFTDADARRNNTRRFSAR